jgi:HSP20 family protein
MSLFRNQSPATRNQNPVNLWQKELNNLFDRFGRDLSNLDIENTGFSPRIEISERNNQYKVCAEVPGVKENEINVTLKDNSLILEGERKTESKKDNEGFFSSEFCYGNFYRAIPLVDEVNPDTVKASYKDGILMVELDKVKPTSLKAKKIPILKS